jgi:N-methylhydantoinase B/oxoprolinase/acetone carboxylase alpha subunit
VAGGNKQRGFIDKEESSFPTVATESVILTLTSLIDAKEERAIAAIDVLNAFIQTVVEDKKKRVIICIRGMLVNMLVKIAPKVYEDYVTFDKKGNKQLLVECLNALYGTMVAALLYYQKFTNTLKEEG